MSKLKALSNGIAWGTVSKVTIVFFQILFMAVMARLLEPADFGLVAIANVCLRFYSYFSQMGIVPAVIQKNKLSDDDIRAALFLSLGVSIVFFIVALVSSNYVGQFFEMERLAVVMQALSLNFIVVGASSVSIGLILRHKKFKAQAIIEVASYVIGYGLVGLLFAFYGAGVWALVFAFMTQTLLVAVFSYIVVRHVIGLKHSKGARVHFINYGGRYSLNGFVEFLTSNLDALVIGKFMGAGSAGLYNRAHLLANLPVQHPSNILTKALFPILGGMSLEYEKQAISLQLSVLCVGCYAFAISLGMYFATPDIVTLLLGAKWGDATPILQVLLLSVGPIYVSHVVSVTFDSIGALGVKLRIQLVTFLVLVILVSYSLPNGVATGIALAVVITEWLKLCMMISAATQLLKIRWVQIAQVVFGILLCGGITGSAVFLATFLGIGIEALITRVLIDVLFGGIGLIISLLLVVRIVSDNSAVLFLAARLPLLKRFMTSSDV